MLPLILDSRSFSNNPLISNLPPITTTTLGLNIAFTQWLSSSFKTGSNNSGYFVNSISLRTREISLSLNLFVDLYTDSAASPDSKIIRFTNPTFIPDTTANYLFTLTTPLLLPANTTYWLVAGISDGGGEYRWAFSDSTVESGLTGWSIGNTVLYSSTQGGFWLNQTGVLQYSINGEEI